MSAAEPRSPPSTDLDRILGYVDAVDERDGLTEVAPEIFLTPFWTPEFCATVVRAVEAAGGLEPDPTDPVPGHEVSLATISPRLFTAVEHDVGTRIWPRLRSAWPLIEYRGLRDAFVIRYTVDEQRALRQHHDIAQVSASVRLNDDYDGAELTFSRQGWDNRDQPIGSLLAWPSLVTHPHESAPLTAGVKYGLTIWCDLPGDLPVL